MNDLTVYVEDGDVMIDGLEYEGEASALYIPLDTMRAAIAAHDAAALWSRSDERDWERVDSSGCMWRICLTTSAVGRPDVYTRLFTVFRNDGDGFVQVGEPHPTWGKAMFAVEGMLAK